MRSEADAEKVERYVLKRYRCPYCRGKLSIEETTYPDKEDDWWVGWIEGIPGVNCQERTYNKLRETLEVTLREALEFNRQDALAAAGVGFKEEKIAI